MAHHDGHGCSGHGHGVLTHGRAFAIGIALNVGFVAVESVYGVLSHSMALVADAGHNLSDVLALGLAWLANLLTQRPPSRRYTYGLRSSSILAALANAMLLMAIAGGILWEAVLRLLSPQSVDERTVIWVATVGIVINATTALMFMRDRHHDMNIRGAYLHMASDAAVSIGVVVAGVGIMWSGWLWLDPAVSIIVVLAIVWSTWDLMMDSIRLALHAVPPGVDASAIRDYLGSLPGVTEVHDLHIWGMSTTETALTVHLVMPEGHSGDGFILAVGKELRDRFHVGHPTIQIETGNAPETCRLAPCSVV